MAGYKRAKFTKEDDEFIRNNYNELSDKEMAKMLGRGVSSIAARRRGMGCRRKEARSSNKMEVSYAPASKPIPMQNLFVRIRTNTGCICVTSTEELINQLQQHKEDKIIKFESYNSIIEMIKDDYMHNDLCMSELIRSNWLGKVDLEDIAILLHWAGEEDTLHDFEIDKYLD